MKQKVVEAIKKDWGSVDLVIYSLASPRRQHPKTGEVAKSILRPIGKEYTNKSIDMSTDRLETVTLPVRLFARLGVSQLIITNAAGCVNTAWNVGDLMLLTGHLDYTFIDGLATPEVRDGAFHAPELLELARAAAHTAGVPLREGVYAWCLGPTFETPAEIREIRRLGGAAVGMSTVPEIRAAAQEGLPILALSALTNYAAGIRDQPLNHQEVLATGQRVKGTFERLVQAVLARLAP